MTKRKGNSHRADWWDKAKASQPVETTTTLQQDLEAIASKTTGMATPAGIAAMALVKLGKVENELAALKAENERLRAALDSVYRKANSMADYYPEPGTERNAYVSDAPEVFNDIRDTALKALQPK